jgi:uncharacterized protein YecE (DUF72 family)
MEQGDHPWGGGRVVQGTCGWSDSSAPWARPASAADRLRVYSGVGAFGCVEVDTSTYQLLAPEHVKRWVGAVPPGFRFCFKAFGFICSRGGLASTLPKDLVPEGVGSPPPPPQQRRVSLGELSDAAVSELWRRFHASLAPALRAGKLGPVLFQFHLGFGPSGSNRAYRRLRRIIGDRDPEFTEIHVVLDACRSPQLCVTG